VLRNKLYYGIKPLVPLSVRLAARRWLALRKRERVRDEWPVLPGSERPPEGWPGWPEGKRFALVLTHDVEGPAGLARVRKWMALEQKLGFRSSFNLIPEGGKYTASKELRDELAATGFEVGVHDLYHDGKLFLTKSEFSRNAVKINQYLKEWGATGFRSGFMLHNLDWIHDLNVQYDTSTFDTDPFEPQPRGQNTIFPFWVQRNGKCTTQNAKAPSGFNAPAPSSLIPDPSSFPGAGYVELPYTLPQDSTLFLLLRERQPDIWFQKLDWIAKHGGMVLLDTHPDYVTMYGEAPKPYQYPLEMYERLLDYVRSRYSGAYWHALPREVARFVSNSATANGAGNSAAPFPVALRHNRKPKIWIDLDNTPHVPFFEPIIEELEARGFPLLVTARDAFQVCDLAHKKRMRFIKIGRHYGKHRLLKAAGLAYRALQLAPVVVREKPALGVSHGARSQLLLSNCLRMPTLLIEDYEYCRFPFIMRPTWVMAPGVIPDSALCAGNGSIRKYPGIKEDVYAWRLDPDHAVLQELGLADSDLVVTVRPPATEAHYHNPESEKLFAALMDRACQTPQVKVVLLPRNKRQGEIIRRQSPKWFENGKTIIPATALDGMNLIWHSDLVVSGGGTMNREAAALGVPVYSIFRGTIGAVDRYLHAEGRLVLLESPAEVNCKIQFVKRPGRAVAEVTSKRTLRHIVDTIAELAERVGHQRGPGLGHSAGSKSV
jgi:hypothetical protein